MSADLEERLQDALKKNQDPKPPRKARSKPKTEVNQTVNGNENFTIGILNGPVIHSPKVVHKTTAEPKPGVENITEEQASTLHRLVGEVAELEKTLKKDPASRQRIWSALNNHCTVATYRMIKLEDFDKAQRYLHAWTGRLRAGKSAPKKDPSWRNKRYAAVHKICKEFDLEARRAQHMQDTFNVSTMTEMDDEQLDTFYRTVLNWKQTKRKKQPS